MRMMFSFRKNQVKWLSMTLSKMLLIKKLKKFLERNKAMVLTQILIVMMKLLRA